MSGFELMCNSGGTLVGYAFVALDCEDGTGATKYQALDATTIQTSLPSGWRPCCSEGASAGLHPMFTDDDDTSTHVGWVYLRYVSETGVYQQQYLTLAGSITTTKPGSWVQGACGSTSGGGGGPSLTSVPDCVHLYLFSGMVLNDTRYPDWGIPGLADADRRDKILLAPGYDGADWTRIAVVLEDVTAPLDEDFTITLLDLTNTITVGSITIGAGTAPTNNEIFRSTVLSSGSFTDNTDIQWWIDECEDDNAFGCHAWGCYDQIVETPS